MASQHGNDFPFDASVTCLSCRLKYVFEGRDPRRRPPWREGLVTIILLAFCYDAWLLYHDVGAVLAIVMLLATGAWMWCRWETGCTRCAGLRQQRGALRHSPGPSESDLRTD